MKMEIKATFLGILTVLSLIGLDLDRVDGAGSEMTCADVIKEMGKRQVSGVGGCSKELNFKNAKDKKERSTCILKCVMKKEKILNSEGKFDMQMIDKMIEENMPPNLTHLREKGEAMFTRCRNEHEPNLDDKDPNCKSYGPLIKCLMGIMSLCKD